MSRRLIVLSALLLAATAVAQAPASPAPEPAPEAGEAPDALDADALDAEALDDNVEALKARLRQLETRMQQCEAQLEGRPLTPPTQPKPITVDPADDGRPPGFPARWGLPATGQTLAEKVKFLEARCLDTVTCARPLVRERRRVPVMKIDAMRRYSAQVGSCAHQCAVEIAVSDAVARAPVPAAPNEAAGIRGPDAVKGLPPYPGEDGAFDALQAFLSVRCRDVACARLSLSASESQNGAAQAPGPAVMQFLQTCAQACAEQKNLSVGQ